MAEKTSQPTAGPSADRRPAPGSPISVIILGGVGVTVIAALAVFVSYNGMYQVARQGNISAEMAHLYPAIFTLLLVMAFWTTYLLRAAPPSQRVWVDILVLALIGIAATTTALHLLNRELYADFAPVLAAVAPWAALLMAFRLWLWVIVHLRDGRARPRAAVRAPRRARRTAELPPDDDTVADEPVEQPRHARGAPDTVPLRSSAVVPGFDAPGPVAADTPLSAEVPRTEVAGDAWFRSDGPEDSDDATVRVLDRDEVADLAEAEAGPPRSDDGDAPAPEAAALDAEPAGSGPAEPLRASEEPFVPAARTDDDLDGADTAAPVEAAEEHDGERDEERDEERHGDRGEPADTAAPAAEPTDEAPAPAAVNSATHDDAAALAAASDVPVLPKRTPTGNPIKHASTNAAAPDSADTEDDGFAGDLLADDPTSDEAHPLIAAPTGPAFDGAAPEAADEPTTAPTPRLHKHPMVLKPRRGTAPSVPPGPPSLRVRSGPIPPEG
ncbi:hypothetical protein CLV63_103372 [Murinocardiopsis flavida]|uniref:DUF2637 domain-containing protein n=1 Tax=Murinocardiopsis flavida TaxID=645275 RepID=A0A2P8DR06_9ACTN|nr:DUF2637 domain-containing protein [Murinocardiopsis flavida]PSK99647.1 hypothetical protein CLV63_103372 [Murinocardiopsis flavida]